MTLHVYIHHMPTPRPSIERYLATKKEVERLVWQDHLYWRGDNKWGSRSRIELGDGSVVVREGDASDFCWAPQANWLTRMAFEPSPAAPQHWRKFERLPLVFDLSALTPANSVAATIAPLIGAAEVGRNGLVVGEWEGWPVLFPALTLLSAMCAPSLTIFNVLMSPVGAGLKLDIKASSPECLVIVRTYGFALVPYRSRAYECLGFWLENSKRRFALQRTYHSIIHNKPLTLPAIPARVQMLADGYTNGEQLLVQRLGANQEELIWPRAWRHLVIRDLDGRDRVACTSKSNEASLSQAVRMFGKSDARSSPPNGA